MTAQSDVFLTGGSGLVGGHLLDRLVETGVSVKALVRSQSAEANVKGHGAVPVMADLLDQESLSEAMRGAHTVFHVAGINDTCPRDVASMDRINVDGTRVVVSAAAAAGISRVVYTSSAAVIGERQGAVGRETTPHSGTFLSPYARSKYLAELAAFEEAEKRGVDLVAVLPSSVQGPGRVGGSARILLRILNSRRPILVDTHVSIVDIDDCTNGHIAASTHGKPGERYLLSSAAVQVGDALDVAKQVTGRAVRPRWISPEIVSAVGLPVAQAVARVRPSAGICPALVRTLLHGHRFDATRAIDELNVSFRPATETLARTIEWFLAEGFVLKS